VIEPYSSGLYYQYLFFFITYDWAQWGSVTHQMAVPVPSISCGVLNHHNLFYQIQNALAFNWDMCCHLALCLCLLPFHWACKWTIEDLRYLRIISFSFLNWVNTRVHLKVHRKIEHIIEPLKAGLNLLERSVVVVFLVEYILMFNWNARENCMLNKPLKAV